MAKTESLADLLAKRDEVKRAQAEQLARIEQQIAEAKEAGLNSAKANYAALKDGQKRDLKGFLQKQRDDLEQLVKDSGYTPTELGIRAPRSSGASSGGKAAGTGTKSGEGKGTRPPVPKYRHPEDPTKLYGGGKASKWIVDDGFITADGKVDISRLVALTDEEKAPYIKAQQAWDAKNPK